MMCGSCGQGRHEECEDVERDEKFLAWITEHFEPKQKLTPEDVQKIELARPYKSCPCHHNGRLRPTMQQLLDEWRARQLNGQSRPTASSGRTRR